VIATYDLPKFSWL